MNEMAVEMKAIALEEMGKEEVKCGGGVILSDASAGMPACLGVASNCARCCCDSGVLPSAPADDVSRATHEC